MGYLLSFMRSMQVSAKKNQLSLEQILIQNQQERITSKLGLLTQMAANIPKDDEGSLQMIEFQKQMLTMMSNNLEARLKVIQTQMQVAASEEAKLNEVLPNQIAASTPKYM
ncbi:MAG: hypothetical protein K6C94_07710 [Candidatus Gastranaerophilales bacterium]|nr:hypothetical protein [Candidatus Gastranaerophilales bacterium]